MGAVPMQLQRMPWQAVTGAHMRALLALPELALVEESCAAERALNESLQKDPTHTVSAKVLARVKDADARENYAVFLRFRDALVQAGTLEACYLGVLRSGAVNYPPVMLDCVVAHILRPLLPGPLHDVTAALQTRAGDMLWRTQRVTVDSGNVLAGDQPTLDMLSDSAGMGDLGRLLVQGGAPMAQVQVEVLSADNAGRYLDHMLSAREAEANASRAHRWLLDLSFDHAQHVGYTLAHPRPGLRALADVLELWVAHFLGVQVHVTPVQKIEDAAWRWHTGLDVEASAILNDLYTGQEAAPERLTRLVSLFRLEFADASDMRADVAGKPVYLGLATKPDGTLKLKPQNLLLNLPLALAND